MMISRHCANYGPAIKIRNVWVCAAMFLHQEMKGEIGNIVKTIEGKTGLSNV